MSQDGNDGELLSPYQGVFIMQGMGVRIPVGGLRIGFGPDGLTSELTLHVAVDACPTWLQVAEEHLSTAKAANTRLKEAAKAGNESDIGRELEADLKASMQSIVASATAVDGLYAELKQHVGLDAATQEAWRSARTARYKQVTEIIRRAFPVSRRHAVGIRSAARALYHYRDKAVHPDRAFSEAVPHPEAHRNTARLYATYRYPNARELATVGMSLVAQCCRAADKARQSAAATYCRELGARVDPVLLAWEANHGEVFKRQPS